MATKTSRAPTKKPPRATAAKKPAAPPTAKKPARAPRAAKRPRYVVIDHPADCERIWPGHYAIRVGSSEAAVEVSIDEGPWMPCRSAAGYFWLDWDAPAGEHVLLARTVDAEGKTTRTSVASTCVVEPW